MCGLGKKYVVTTAKIFWNNYVTLVIKQITYEKRKEEKCAWQAKWLGQDLVLEHDVPHGVKDGGVEKPGQFHRVHATRLPHTELDQSHGPRPGLGVRFLVLLRLDHFFDSGQIQAGWVGTAAWSGVMDMLDNATRAINQWQGQHGNTVPSTLLVVIIPQKYVGINCLRTELFLLQTNITKPSRVACGVVGQQQSWGQVAHRGCRYVDQVLLEVVDEGSEVGQTAELHREPKRRGKCF